MVSFNNAVMKCQRDADRHDVYGLRKLSVGVGSVLLGTMLYAGVSGPAHADVLPTTGASNNDVSTSGDNAVGQTSVTSQASSAEQTNVTSQAVSTASVAMPSSVASQTPVQSTVAQAPVSQASVSNPVSQATYTPVSTAASTDFQLNTGNQSYYVATSTTPAVNLNSYRITTNDQQNYQVGFKANQVYSGNVTLPNLADIQQKYQQAKSITFNPTTINSNTVQNVTGLNVSNTDNQKLALPANMSNAFANFKNLQHLDLSNADAAKVTNLDHAFANLKQLQTVDLSGWNTKSVSDVRNLFAGDRVLSQIKGIENWNLSNAKSLAGMFSNTSALKTISLINVKTSNQLTDTSNMFANSGVDKIAFGNMNLDSVTNAHAMFANTKNLASLSGLTVEKTSAIKDASEMFKRSGLPEVNMDWLSGQNVTNMSGMFAQMPNLVKIANLKGFGYRNSSDDVAKVTMMDHLVNGDSKLSDIDLSGFSHTSQLKDLTNAFSNSGLKTLDISYLNPEKVISMHQIAYNDPELTLVALGNNFNASSVRDLQQAFARDPKLSTFDLSNFKTGAKKVDTKEMFTDNIGMTSLSGLRGINSMNKQAMLSGVNPDALLYGTSKDTYDGAIARLDKPTHLLVSKPVRLVDQDYKEGMKDKNGKPLQKVFTYLVQGEVNSKQPTNFEQHIPAGYQIAANGNTYLNLIEDDGPAITMYIQHAYDLQPEEKHFTETVRVVYKDAKGNLVELFKDFRHQTIGYTLQTDKVTGQKNYLKYADTQFNPYQLPDMTSKGFKPASGTKPAPAIHLLPNAKTDYSFDFLYVPISGTVSGGDTTPGQGITHVVQFVDDDYQAGMTDRDGNALNKQVASYSVNGNDNTSVALNIDSHIPSGYQVFPHYTYPTEIVLDAKNNQPTIIHLVHGTSEKPIEVDYTRSVKGIDADDPDNPLFTQSQSSHIYATQITDLVTGKTSILHFPTDQKIDAFTLPEEPGYVPENNIKSLPEIKITPMTKTHTEITVVYHRVQMTYTVYMVDDDFQPGMKDKNGKALSKNVGSYTVKGVSGSSVDLDLNSHIPAGYSRIPGVDESTLVILDPAHTSETLHLIHAKSTELITLTYHRDVKGIAPDQTKPLFSSDQKVSVPADRVTDELTGKTSIKDFPANAAFPVFNFPDESQYGYATDDATTALPAMSITIDTPKSISKTVKYHKIYELADLEIEFIDLDKGGEVIGNGMTIHGSKGQEIPLQQYVNTSYSDYFADPDENQMNGNQLAPYKIPDVGSQAIKVYLHHKIDDQTQKREIHRRVYLQDPVTKQNTLVKDQTITATRQHRVDLVDPSQFRDSAWKGGTFDSIDLSSYHKDGYTLSESSVKALTLSDDDIDGLKPASDGFYRVKDVIVSYNQTAQPIKKVNVHVQFIDSVSGKQIGTEVDQSVTKGTKIDLQDLLNNQKFAGYEIDSTKNAMNGNQLSPYTVTDAADQTVKVYLNEKASAQVEHVAVNLQFIDADDNNKVLNNKINVSAMPNEMINLQQYLNAQFGNYTADPKLNKMNGNQVAPYQATKDAKQTVKVYLRHKIDDETQKVNIHRRIYLQDPVTKQNKLIKDQVVVATRHHVQDLANPMLVNDSPWTVGQLPAFDLVPYQKAGYQLDPASISALTLSSDQVSALLPDEDKKGDLRTADVIVAYYAQDVDVKLQFVDADNNNSPVGFVHALKGQLGQNVDWTKQVPVPANYELDPKADKNVQFDKSKTVTIALRHKKIAIPNDQDHQDELTESVARTINFVDAKTGEALQKPLVQRENFTRQGWQDLVTGQSSYGKWTLTKDSTNANKAQFDVVNPPTIKGYKLQTGQKVDIVFLNPDKLPQDRTVNVKYDKNEVVPSTPDKKVVITFKVVDKDTGKEIVGPFTMSGKPNTTSPFLIGKTLISDGYTLTPDSKKLVTPVVYDWDKTITLYVTKNHATDNPVVHITLGLQMIDEDDAKDPLMNSGIGFKPVVITADNASTLVDIKEIATANGFNEKLQAWEKTHPQYEFVNTTMPDKWSAKMGITPFITVRVKHRIQTKVEHKQATEQVQFVNVQDQNLGHGISLMLPITLTSKTDMVSGKSQTTLAFDGAQKSFPAYDLKSTLQKYFANQQLLGVQTKGKQLNKVNKDNLLVPELTPRTDDYQFAIRVVLGKAGHPAPQLQSVEWRFVDADANNQLVGKASVVASVGSNADLTSARHVEKGLFAKGYKLLNDQKDLQDVKIGNQPAIYVIQLTHAENTITQGKASAQVVISFKNADGSDYQPAKIVNLTAPMIGTYDMVTKQFTADSARAKLLMNSVSVDRAGYTAHLKVVANGDQNASELQTLDGQQIVAIPSFTARNGSTTRLVVTYQPKVVEQVQKTIQYKMNDGQLVGSQEVSGPKNFSQKVAYQLPDGYHTVDGSQNVEISFSNADPVVVYVAKDGLPTVTKTIQFMNGTKQVGQQNVQGQQGATSSVDLHVPDGYQLVDGQNDPLKVVFGQDGNLTVAVKPVQKNDQLTRDIVYVLNGETIVGRHPVSGIKGQPKEVALQVPAGYHVITGNSSLLLPMNDTTDYQVAVDVTQAKTTISYVDNQSGQTVNQQVVSGNEGAHGTVQLRVPGGYKLVNDNETLPITYGQPATVAVEKVSHPVDREIDYTNSDGDIISRQTVSGDAGSQKSIDLNVPTGYHTVGGQTQLPVSFDNSQSIQVVIARNVAPSSVANNTITPVAQSNVVRQLPQTGNQKNEVALVALGLLTLGLGFGLLKEKH